MNIGWRMRFIGSVTFILLIAGALCALAQDRPRFRNRPAASRPAARPVAEAYPPKSLIDACDKAAAQLRKKLDKSFHVLVRPPFVIAGNMPTDDLDAHARGSVHAPAEAMWKSYFRHKPDRVITVLLFTDQGAPLPKEDKEAGYVYRKWARELFGDTDVCHYGYYKPDKRTMVMNIDTGGGTLVHELTHALIVYDFDTVPTWFNEGLGSLHEQCQVGKDEVIGLENWRLPALQKAIAAGKLRPLKDLISQDNFRDKRTEGINYAHARYFVMYMQHKGVLKDFHVYLRDHYVPRPDNAPDTTAIEGVEKLFKKRIDKVEKEFVEWVKTLHFP